jgi:hypothetical protein
VHRNKFILNIQLAGNNRRRKDLYTLPREDQELLNSLGYKEKLANVDKAILANAEFLSKVVASPQIFESDNNEFSDDEHEEGEPDKTAGLIRTSSKSWCRYWLPTITLALARRWSYTLACAYTPIARVQAH